MERAKIREAFGDFQRMTSGPHRETNKAPHKPVLCLFALSNWLRRGDSILRFRTVHEPLQEAIRSMTKVDYVEAEQPFWRLQREPVQWVVTDGEGKPIAPVDSDPPSATKLIQVDARGQFSKDFGNSLFADAGLVFEVMGLLIEQCKAFSPDTDGLLKHLQFRDRW